MNIETIKMDPRIARIHYADYRKRCAVNREKRRAAAAASEQKARSELSRIEKEDEELLKAYRALYRGQQLLDLPRTIGGGGLTDDKKLPRLAVLRADRTTCHLWIVNGVVTFNHEEIWRSYKLPPSVMRFGQPAVPAELWNDNWRNGQNLPNRAKAIVPTVPPHLRPDDLSKYFILWEAEWQPRAPVDPILLSQVNATLFAVVAQWDLTPLEQRVLEGRL